MQFSAAELAQRLGLAVQGDATTTVTGVATLARATPQSLSFLANPRYRAQLAGTGAGIVVMREADAEGYPGTALVASDPYTAFAKAAALWAALIAANMIAGLLIELPETAAGGVGPLALGEAFLKLAGKPLHAL